MDCIFYWDPSDVRIAQRFCQVIQVDSTFKDNTWGYPLLEITATTNEMNTFLIAQALIQSESTETLLWVFEQVCLVNTHSAAHLINSKTDYSSMSVYSKGNLVPVSS